MGISHKWNGTVLTITSDSGTSSADLKGEKGDTGVRGAQGVAGIITDTTGAIELSGYEKTENKADTLFVMEQEKLEGKYPSALAAKSYADNFGSTLTTKTQELEQMAISLSQNKVDKEEGKELYRGMEEIVDYTTTEVLDLVNFSFDKNEQPFKLDEVYLFISSPTVLPQTSTTLTANFNGGSGSKYKWFLTGIKQGTQTLQAYAKKLCYDRWFTLYHQTSSTIYNNTYMTGYSMGNVGYINSILIEGLGAYPAGTRIRVCGRRVD